MKRRDFLMGLAGATGALMLPEKWAYAQSRDDSLRVLSEGAANSFDAFSIGVNRNAIQINWNVYDRLVTFAYKARPDGTFYYDYFDIKGELAESYKVSDDKKSITFNLRKDALFHDGTPVTAEDVKWSLDRVVASAVGKSQFSTGSMTDPKQFVVVDAHTIRIDLPQPDRFALPNLALTYPIIVNSKLARKNATPTDPFAMEWLKTNAAAGGAYKIEQAAMGERVMMVRNDAWKSGPLPRYRRVLWQTVPAAESRVASLVRGNADIVQDLPPKDVVALLANPSVKIVGVPTSNFQFIGMNNAIAPFNDVRVRQAIAHALPYDDMFKAALFARGRQLFGASWNEAPDASFPQRLPLRTDLARAKSLMAEAGMAGGFATSFSFAAGASAVAEPMAALVKEALAKIGIEVTIQKMPDAQFTTMQVDRRLPFFAESGTAWLPATDYFFRTYFSGRHRWNFSGFKNAELDDLVQAARFETDAGKYAAACKRMIAILAEDVPSLMLWQPNQDAAMAPGIDGYTYWFHRQVDYRDLRRA